MSGGKKKSTQSQQSYIDPNVYQALYGTGARQQIYDGGGNVRTPGRTGTGGILTTAQDLANQPALNETQLGALTGMADYLTGPDSLAGWSAMQNASNYLMQPSGGPGPIVNSPTRNFVDWNSIREGFGNDIDAYRGMLPDDVWASMVSAPELGDAATMDTPERVRAANIVATGGPGGVGVNWRSAAERAMSGEVDNPYLQGVADYSAKLAGDTFLRQVAPQLRSGARMSGLYGGSRQGIAEGIAAGDLQRDILGNTSNLFGGAYENAQQRAAQVASQMGGYDTQRAIAGAQISAQQAMAQAQLEQQAALANQNAMMQAGMFNVGQINDWNRFGAGLDFQAGLSNQDAGLRASLANQQAGLAGMGQLMDFDLGMRGLGLNAAQAQSQYDLGLRGLNLDAQRANAQNWLANREMNSRDMLAGAGLAGQASQIPLANLQALYGVGEQVRNAPWQQYQNWASLLYPTMDQGQYTRGEQTTKSSMGTGQILGGIASLGLGAMTGGLGLGMGGLLGGAGNIASVMGPLAGAYDATRSLFGGGLYTPSIYQPRIGG